MILLDPKSEKIRLDRIRIGFGSDLHTSSCNNQKMAEMLRRTIHYARCKIASRNEFLVRSDPGLSNNKMLHDHTCQVSCQVSFI